MSSRTEKIEEIKQFINDYISENGYAPALGEISAKTGIAKTTAYRYINGMIERGELDSGGRSRVATKDTSTPTCRVPILGRVACGIPKFAEENIEEYVRLPVALFGKGDFFILRATGDSMINAGIEDNDLVLVRKQNTAEPGQIVVALIEDEATLKRFYPEHGHVRLHPENPAIPDIIVPECEIQGIAVKVIKDLE